MIRRPRFTMLFPRVRRPVRLIPGPSVFLISLVFVACVSTDLAPIGSTQAFVPETDERNLWEAGRQAELRVLPANLRYEDPATERYLADLLGRLIPASYTQAGGPPIQVRVRKDPRLNAFAMPHGLIVVHTSILSRAENEGQIAGVLAHELTHITHRHLVREARAIQNRETALNVTAFIGTLAIAALAVDQAQRGHPQTADAILTGGTPLLMVGLKLTHAAMVNGYSRELEREADEEGARLMAAAGYSPRDMVAFFRTLQAESPDRGALETFFYGNHPRIAERISDIETLSPSIKVAERRPIVEGDAFHRRLVGIRSQNAQWDAYFGRVALAQTQMRQVIAVAPIALRSALEPLLAGHMSSATFYGSRARQQGDLREPFIEAQRQYKRAIAEGKDQPETRGIVAQAYKSLGHLYQAGGISSQLQCAAKEAYGRYLELVPGAADRSAIEASLARLSC